MLLFIFMNVFVCIVQAKKGNPIPKAEEPKVLSVEANISVVVGRDVSLPCVVEHLGDYKVAWLRVDTQTILTIGGHVITKNHRVGVGRGDAHSWALTVRYARPADAGRYMCQINTEPMITRTHHLDVLVPPDILPSDNGEVLAQEGESVSMHCEASGRPRPSVTWRREDSAEFSDGGRRVSKWSSEWLNLTTAHREQSGAYLCIATNGVPPSVSKRVVLHVLCKPSVRVTVKKIGDYTGESLRMSCLVEAYPTPVIYWTRAGADARLINGSKYQTTVASQGYKHICTLKINGLARSDIDLYYCHADNSLGSAKDDFTIYNLATTTFVSTTRTNNVETMTTLLFQIQGIQINSTYTMEMDTEQDAYEVVVSPHRMQNIDMPPSL